MVDKLKPCPFCGREARLIEIECGTTNYSVECVLCQAKIGWFDEKEQAIKAWNKHTNPWHTDTPTEEGWYLLHVRGTIPFRVAYMRNWQWLSTDDSRIRTDVVIKWQKIEEGEVTNG